MIDHGKDWRISSQSSHGRMWNFGEAVVSEIHIQALEKKYDDFGEFSPTQIMCTVHRVGIAQASAVIRPGG
ncbi:hypothetical protein OF385_06875 [Glutamicibacter sp. JL.03c]|uniref:hypothetical protein n=1 Tax=Glutamicibacter sp. JL.03c TaxID=2984842 RepID=UPI0021F794F5|nr:hypothetical protein [Glutamicibacter sp. JL.03c]UYQ78856.1 hypothetical protein OF385_06875 [Glutamicibacter sp. JL.03c]